MALRAAGVATRVAPSLAAGQARPGLHLRSAKAIALARAARSWGSVGARVPAAAAAPSSSAALDSGTVCVGPSVSVEGGRGARAPRAGAAAAVGAIRCFARSPRSPKVRDLQTPVWSPTIHGSLERVNDRVDQALQDLRDLRQQARVWSQDTEAEVEDERQSEEWARGFKALLAIHRSPAKHLLRPQLVLLGVSHSESAFDADAPHMPHVEAFAAGVELQHLFMLVHDDVIDRGTRRRGVAPVHVALRGEYRTDVSPGGAGGARARRMMGQLEAAQLATLIGDVVHARAMGMLFEGASGVGQPTACDVLLHHSYKAAAAQFDDVVGWRGMEHIFATSEEPKGLMRQVLLDKGARHTMCAPLMAGMRLGGAGDDIMLAGRVWGEHAGIALQAMDDVADLIGNFISTGKDTFQDIRDGRLSLLLFLLWRRASPEQWADVAAFMRRGGETVMMPHERKYFMDLMEQHGLVDTALRFARDELDAAEAAIADLAPDTVLAQGLRAFAGGLRSHCEKLEAQAASHNDADDSDAGAGAF